MSVADQQGVALCVQMLQYAFWSDHTGDRRPSEVIEALKFFFPDEVIAESTAVITGKSTPRVAAIVNDAGKVCTCQPVGCGDGDTFVPSPFCPVHKGPSAVGPVATSGLGGFSSLTTAHFDCHRCANGKLLALTYMILCPICGNKRCPKASDHDLACTGSNEPGQQGSIY